MRASPHRYPFLALHSVVLIQFAVYRSGPRPQPCRDRAGGPRDRYRARLEWTEFALEQVRSLHASSSGPASVRTAESANVAQHVETDALKSRARSSVRYLRLKLRRLAMPATNAHPGR